MNPFEHQVRERAYYIWEDEGRVFGRSNEHWLRAETELRAHSFVHEPVLVVAAAPALTVSASPANVLGATLKAKPSRTRTVTAKVEAKVKTAAKADAKEVVEPAMALVGASAPVTKAATAKPAASKSVVPSKAPATSKSAKAPKAASRPRAAESVSTVH